MNRSKNNQISEPATIRAENIQTGDGQFAARIGGERHLITDHYIFLDDFDSVAEFEEVVKETVVLLEEERTIQLCETSNM